MIDPTYDSAVGRTVPLSHDWPTYFHQVDSGPGGVNTFALPTLGEFELKVDRTHSGSQFQYPLDWFGSAEAPDQVIPIWIQNVVGKHYQRVERAYFKNVPAMPRKGPERPETPKVRSIQEALS